jgi:DNA (cytosine-5)-methyltransferase 1
VNELALFAGAGGGILGGHLLGWRTICAVEWEPYAAAVLIQRQNDGILPAFPIWDDVRTFDGKPWQGIVDVISGGFPCQAYSQAAAGRNTADDLWPEMRRVVADVAPRYVFAENVSRIAIEQAAIDLESMGYKTRSISLSASDLGGDHVRERFWLCGYADGDCKSIGAKHEQASWMQEFCSGVWQNQPVGLRMADGVAARVDRLKAIGNGQVPAVAATAWNLLK